MSPLLLIYKIDIFFSPPFFFSFVSFLSLTSVLCRPTRLHTLPHAVYWFCFNCCSHLTSPLCSLLAATMRRSFGSRGRCGLRVLTSYSSEYRSNRTLVRQPWLGSALLLISLLAPPVITPMCSHKHPGVFIPRQRRVFLS